MTTKPRAFSDQADIRDIAYAMARFHGEENAIVLARQYSAGSMNSERWRAVVSFLEERANLRKQFER